MAFGPDRDISESKIIPKFIFQCLSDYKFTHIITNLLLHYLVREKIFNVKFSWMLGKEKSQNGVYLSLFEKLILALWCGIKCICMFCSIALVKHHFK